MKTLTASKTCKSLRQLDREGTGGAGRWKLRRIKYCLAEAKRQKQRCFLKEARSITLHTDARRGRLLVLWTAAGKHFVARSLAGSKHGERH